jgi:hypothetical protein
MDVPVDDPTSIPLVWDGRGYLVAIVEDDAEAERARLTLRSAEFGDDQLRAYTTAEMIEHHERFLANRSVAQRVVGAITDDRDAIKHYFAYARDGRAAVWVRVADRDAARRAVGALTDLAVLHIRYYGEHGPEDLRLGLG